MTAAARAWEAEADVRDAASTPFSRKPRSWQTFCGVSTTRRRTGRWWVGGWVEVITVRLRRR